MVVKGHPGPPLIIIHIVKITQKEGAVIEVNFLPSQMDPPFVDLMSWPKWRTKGMTEYGTIYNLLYF